jgi:hypothetical protein
MAEASIRARIAADASGFNQTLKSTEQAAQAWGQRMARTTSQAGAGMGKGGMGGSMALLEFSRAAEDAQYGIKGVLNNIPGLAMALGGGAGLAGAASLAAVAVATLGKAFYDWVANTEAIKEATKVTEELGKKLDAAVGKSAAESIKGTAKAATELKEALAAADKEFQDSSSMLAATHADEEERIRAEMELRLHWLARVEEAHGKAAIAQIKAQGDFAKVQEDARRADEAEVERLAELARLRERLNQVKAQGAAQTAIELAAGGGAVPDPEIQRLEAQIAAGEAIKPRDRMRDEMAANKALAAGVNLAEAAVAAEEARAKVERERIIGIGKIGEVRKKAAEDAAQAQKKTDDEADAAHRERLRDQKEQYDWQDRQLEIRAKLKEATDKEAAAQKKLNAEHKEALGDLQAEARIKGLRDQGRDTQANREERALRVQQRTRQIMDLGQSTPAQAVHLAEQLEGGGRISARSRRHRQAGGIDEITEAPTRASSSELRQIRNYLKDIKDNTDGQGKNKSAPIPRQD